MTGAVWAAVTAWATAVGDRTSSHSLALAKAVAQLVPVIRTAAIIGPARLVGKFRRWVAAFAGTTD